jgi:uncharacterized protein (DUF302 family)
MRSRSRVGIHDRIKSSLWLWLLWPATAIAQDRTPASEGVIAYASDASFEETVRRVEPAITDRNLMVMRIIDHAGAAADMGLELSPNTVVLFGNPRVGSQIMTCAPRAGIDLPQRLHVWEADGAVHVGYNDPRYLASRHAIEGCGEILARVSEALDAIAKEVAGAG